MSIIHLLHVLYETKILTCNRWFQNDPSIESFAVQGVLHENYMKQGHPRGRFMSNSLKVIEELNFENNAIYFRNGGKIHF